MVVDVNSQYVGARYVPKFYENPVDGSPNWKADVDYEWFTIVTDNGDSYTSKKAVPRGVGRPSENPAYWVKTGDFNASLLSLQNRVGNIESEIGHSPLETEARTLSGAINEVLHDTNDVNNKIVVATDFDGDTDAEILQNAINAAIEKHYSTILLNKEFDIGDSTLYIDKGLYLSNDDYTRYRSKLTFIGIDGGKIKKSGNGFFFSAHERSGDISFINVSFEGNVDPTDVSYESLIVGNSIFDCSKLIRINTTNCSYCLVGCVFDGTLSSDTNSNIQSNYSLQDLLTYSGYMYKINFSYDVHINNALVEQCGGFVKVNRSATAPAIYDTFIDGCCIEGIHDDAIDFKCNTSDGDPLLTLGNVNILNNYFESAGNNCINMDAQYIYNAFIRGNKFSLGTNLKAIVINQRNNSITVSNNLVTGSAGTFLYIVHNGTVSFSKTITSSNSVTGGVSTSNNVEDMLDIEYDIIASYKSVEEAALTDANNVGKNMLVKVKSTDTVSNMPDSADGVFITVGRYGTNITQKFITASKIYERARIAGVGWTSWRDISFT